MVRAWDGCGGDTLAREVDGEGKDAPHQPGDNGDEQSVLGEPLAHDDVDDEDDPYRAVVELLELGASIPEVLDEEANRREDEQAWGV